MARCGKTMNEGTAGTDIYYLSGNELLWDQHNTRPIDGRPWLQTFFLIKRHQHTLSALGFLVSPIDFALLRLFFRPLPASSKYRKKWYLADFSDNQTDMLPFELESKRDCNVGLVFLDVGKTNRSVQGLLTMLKG